MMGSCKSSFYVSPARCKFHQHLSHCCCDTSSPTLMTKTKQKIFLLYLHILQVGNSERTAYLTCRLSWEDLTPGGYSATGGWIPLRVHSLTELVVNTSCLLGPQLGLQTGTLTLGLSMQLCGLTLRGLGFRSKHLERARPDAVARCFHHVSSIPGWSYLSLISRKGTNPAPQCERCQDHIVRLIGNTVVAISRKYRCSGHPLATVLHMPLTCKTLLPSSKPTPSYPTVTSLQVI